MGNATVVIAAWDWHRKKPVWSTRPELINSCNRPLLATDKRNVEKFSPNNSVRKIEYPFGKV